MALLDGILGNVLGTVGEVGNTAGGILGGTLDGLLGDVSAGASAGVDATVAANPSVGVDLSDVLGLGSASVDISAPVLVGVGASADVAADLHHGS